MEPIRKPRKNLSPAMFEDLEMNFETLKLDPDYIIRKEYPYDIVRKDTLRKISVVQQGETYKVHINYKPYLLPYVIAYQWIPNPDGYQYIRYKNFNRNDFHVENLYWARYYQKPKNKPGPELFTDFAKNHTLVPIKKYFGHVYAPDTFYYVPEANVVVQHKGDYFRQFDLDKNNKFIIREYPCGPKHQIDLNLLLKYLEFPEGNSSPEQSSPEQSSPEASPEASEASEEASA